MATGFLSALTASYNAARASLEMFPVENGDMEEEFSSNSARVWFSRYVPKNIDVYRDRNQVPAPILNALCLPVDGAATQLRPLKLDKELNRLMLNHGLEAFLLRACDQSGPIVVKGEDQVDVKFDIATFEANKELFSRLPAVASMKLYAGEEYAVIKKDNHVFIKNDRVPDSDSPDYACALWKARILELRGRNRRRIAKVMWYESAEEFCERPSVKRQLKQRGSKLKAITDSMTGWELIQTSDIGYIDVTTIEDTMWINVWADSEPNTWLQTFGEWIARWQRETDGGEDDLTPAKPANPDRSCDVCRWGFYNPEHQVQQLCLECDRWYHIECLTELPDEDQVAGQPYVPGTSIVDHILDVPLTRGIPTATDGPHLLCAGWERIRSYCQLLSDSGAEDLPKRWYEELPNGWDRIVCSNWDPGEETKLRANAALKFLKSKSAGQQRYLCQNGHKI